MEWKRIARTLVELRAITAADLFLVELLASTMATVRTAEVTLEAEGSCATGTAANGLKGHPAARVLATARAQAARLLGELGLTPRGRAMLDLHPAALPELVDDDDGQPGMSLDQYLASNPDLRPAARRR